MASINNERYRKRERKWINMSLIPMSKCHQSFLWSVIYFLGFITSSLSTPLPMDVTINSTIKLDTNDPNKIRGPRTYPSSYQYQPQYDYSGQVQGSQGQGYSNYPSSSSSYQYNYPNQPSYNYYPPPSHSSGYYSPGSSFPSSSYTPYSYPPSSSSPSSSDEGPVFLGGVFDLSEFSKMSNIPISELLKMGSSGLKSNSKSNKEDETDDDEDEMSELSRKRISQSHVSRRKKKRKKKRPKLPSSSVHLLNRRGGSDGRGSEDHEEDNPDDDEIEELDDQDEKSDEKVKNSANNDEFEDEDDVVLKITRERNKSRSKNTQSKAKSKTTTTTTMPPIQPYPVMPVPYPYPVPATAFGGGQTLLAGSPSSSSLTTSSQLQSEESQLKPTSVKIGKKPSKHDIEDDVDQPPPRPVKENIINVNLPDLFGDGGVFDAFDTNRGDIYSSTNGLSGINSHRRVSISGFTQGIVKRALKSMVYRIFPSVKNAKRVAAKGCRDVQTIGSMDSILMPLGIAVTLHPLLLPLVPFLLLALGSIKAIESATCFVSEFFK